MAETTTYRKAKAPRIARTSGRALTMAFLMTMLGAVFLLASPKISLSGGFMNISNAILAMGFLVAGVLWAIIEIYTPPGKSTSDLLLRWVVALLIGVPIGGVAGYISGFGPLIILPASQGNAFAFLVEVAFLWLTACVMFAAAWWHSRGVVA